MNEASAKLIKIKESIKIYAKCWICYWYDINESQQILNKKLHCANVLSVTLKSLNLDCSNLLLVIYTISVSERW